MRRRLGALFEVGSKIAIAFGQTQGVLVDFRGDGRQLPPRVETDIEAAEKVADGRIGLARLGRIADEAKVLALRALGIDGDQAARRGGNGGGDRHGMSGKRSLDWIAKSPELPNARPGDDPRGLPGTEARQIAMGRKTSWVAGLSGGLDDRVDQQPAGRVAGAGSSSRITLGRHVRISRTRFP